MSLCTTVFPCPCTFEVQAFFECVIMLNILKKLLLIFTIFYFLQKRSFYRTFFRKNIPVFSVSRKKSGYKTGQSLLLRLQFHSRSCILASHSGGSCCKYDASFRSRARKMLRSIRQEATRMGNWKKQMEYVVGVDFGSDSVRAVIVRASDGQVAAEAAAAYPRWAQGLYCDPGIRQFRQHP